MTEMSSLGGVFGGHRQAEAKSEAGGWLRPASLTRRKGDSVMPLKRGSSKKTVESNFHEFHKGPTFKHTERKFGKKRADKQAVAVVLSEARKSRGKR